MKIHNCLALLLLAAGLSACGSDPGVGSNGEALSLTSPVITSTEITAPTEAGKAAVGFQVVFPEQDGVQKAALNPTMNKVTIDTSGVCGVKTLTLTPSNTSGTMTLGAGTCTFVATSYNSFNGQIETAKTQGTLLAGANNVSLTFLGGPWLFVDPSTNEKLPLTLVGNEVLTGIRLEENNGAMLTRWFGPDTLGDGPTGDDLMGGTLITPPQLRVTGTFSGGTGVGANLMRLVSGASNLTNWEGNVSAGQRAIQILGSWPSNPYPKTFNPLTFRDFYNSKIIDGTTIEGNIAEFTFDTITVGTPYGTCTPVVAAPAQSAAVTKALSPVQKAQTPVVGTVTISWTQCNASSNQNEDIVQTLSNITIHPFRAKSSFADPASALQVEVNAALANYKKALATEDFVNGTDLTLLRKAASQFVAATGLAGNSTSNTADTARFFGAISHLASLVIDTSSDGTADGLNDFNDVLDALGAPTDALSRSWSNTITLPETCVTVPYLDCRPNLPTTSPTSGQLLTLLDSKVTTQLDLAIADLAKVSAGFSFNFTDPVSGATTNFDYGDALALTAFAHGIKAELAIDMAYDLNLDIDATINGAGPASVQAFLTANPNIGKLDATRYASELAQAKTDLQTGLNKMKNAITTIEAEGTGISQQTEFISFYSTNWECVPDAMGCTWTEVDRTVQEIANTRDAIDKALLGLSGPITVDDNGTPTITTDDVIIDPSKFFAGINFRGLFPGFTGDVPNGLFTDGTMGGVLVQNVTLNEDIDGNGKPDLLEKPNFYPALISGKSYINDVWSPTFSLYQNITFSTGTTSGTFTSDWSYNQNIPVDPFYIYQTGTSTGTWQILTDGTLQLIFTTGAPLNITGVNSSLSYYPDAMDQGFDAKTTITFADSQTMTTYSWWMTPQTQPF